MIWLFSAKHQLQSICTLKMKLLVIYTLSGNTVNVQFLGHLKCVIVGQETTMTSTGCESAWVCPMR